MGIEFGKSPDTIPRTIFKLRYWSPSRTVYGRVWRAQNGISLQLD
ncbi:predicted protein [Botrytis cinerea T4]|uniref:Uncharacterized protein n=1 Tax=Botryotinia fuckeliana (strain T4) TaxID=999810 RepID=G2YZ37_BOTF4|nr:predicted protein [Botrytis cinerea T4]